MAAKIYQSPLPEPQMDWNNPQEWQATEDKFIAELRAWLKNEGYTGKNVGEILRFGVADGYAQYMVGSMRPLMLIHLNLLDGYSFQHIDLMTAKAVNEKIDQQNALSKFIAENKNNKSK